MQSSTKRLSNGQRRRKKQAQKQQFQNGYLIKHANLHDYYQNRNGKMSQKRQQKYCQKYGYAEIGSQNKVLWQLQQTFNSKLKLCFPHYRVRDMGRKDYYERNEKIGFKFQKNPIINFVQKLQKKLVGPVIGEAMQKICQLKIQKNKYYENQRQNE